MALKLKMEKILILICFMLSAQSYAQEVISMSIGQSMAIPLMGYNSGM